jgi:uncharacterized repeat protein (TIGR02543 family)
VTGSGMVTKNPDQATYLPGSAIQLTAAPATGWSFTGWSGAASGSANPLTVTMNANKTITATFTQNHYTLTVNVVGNGTVTKNPNQATYHYGDTVKLTAAPAAGWSFAGWSGSASGTANPLTVTMNGNKVITATFTQNHYTLTVNVVGSGTVPRNPNLATYHYGDTVTLTAIPNTGWKFIGWSGGLTGATNPATILINGNKSVTATFESLIFSNSFGSCSASGWSSFKTGVNITRLEFSSAAAWTQPCGMAVRVTTSDIAYVRDNTPNLEKHYRASFYFNHNLIQMGNSDAHQIFTAYNSANQAIFVIELRKNGSLYQMRAGTLTDTGSWSYTAWVTSAAGWKPVVVDWRAATVAGANNGSLSLKVGSASAVTVTALNNDTRRIDFVLLGALFGIDPTTRGVYYFDEFSSWR